MKKSAKTAVIVIAIIAAVLGLLAIGGLFSSRVESLSTTDFFKKAGIEYRDAAGSAPSGDYVTDGDKIIVFNKENAKIAKIKVNVYSITGYDEKGNAIAATSLYPQTFFSSEIELLKKNGYVL